MSFGGGYKAPEDNSVELNRQQAAEREANRVREEERSAQQRQEQQQRFSSGLETGMNNFRQRGTQRLNNMGLDPGRYGSLIEDAITGARSNISDNDPNPAQYFTDDLLDTQINRKQGDRRTNFTRQVSGMFGDGFENNYFNDTDDDPFIDAVLGRQRGEAVSALDMAKRRGNLNDSGYNAALGRLGEMEKSGRSTANTLSGSVLQGYRSQLRGIGDEAFNAAGSYTLGSGFDPTRYQSRLESTAGDLRGRLEGDVTSALAGQQFFDIGDIITRGGTAQGPVNPRTAQLDALAERDRMRNTDRGVGGSGVF